MLTPDADPGFWSLEQLAVSAAYLRKNNVSRAFAGRGLGSCLRRWMVPCAARSGAQVVRGSCWTDNAALLAYYLQQGWEYVGTVSVDRSGVLLEVRAVARDDLPVIRPRRVDGGLLEAEVEFPRPSRGPGRPDCSSLPAGVLSWW